jgi:hypothetical protein
VTSALHQVDEFAVGAQPSLTLDFTHIDEVEN